MVAVNTSALRNTRQPWGKHDSHVVGAESSLFETKGRIRKRGTVQLARTRDTPRAKQSYTENFHRTSHRAHRHFPEVIADVAHSIVPRVLSSSDRPALSAKPHLNMVPACGCR
eukprot:scaffold2004_cov73-Phaeocystis_antarctica.AAC.1